MPQGLAVSRLINVQVILSPVAAQGANFNSCMLVGASDVINVEERFRTYNSIEEVAADFGTTAPEYKAAINFFSQVPQPVSLYIGRWAKNATPALMIGGILNATQQLIGTWTAIANGGFTVTVAGSAHNITGLDFSAQTNLNGVASVINTAVSAFASCVWDGESFVLTSTATGEGTTITFATAPGSGTDISEMLRWTQATDANIVEGIDAETPVEAVVILDGVDLSWYALTFAVDPVLTNDQILAVSDYFEAANNKHLFGITTQETAALSMNDTTSIIYLFSVARYNRSFAQYSSSSPYAVASFIGRGVTVNFAGNNTVINFMWKQEPGVVAEFLTPSQADALDEHNGNYFAAYQNDTAIIVNGQVGSGAYVDEIWGLDWLGNEIQTGVFNVLYTAPTKVPQTDPGTQLLIAAVDKACAQGVVNGLIAPGVWDLPGFGQLQQGQLLDKGYYIYAPLVATQSAADRAARKSVPIQVAVKLAGAINTVQITVTVNR